MYRTVYFYATIEIQGFTNIFEWKFLHTEAFSKKNFKTSFKLYLLDIKQYFLDPILTV